MSSRGNIQLPFSDLDSLHVADLLSECLEEKGLN
jgi:hypothetical protein